MNYAPLLGFLLIILALVFTGIFAFLDRKRVRVNLRQIPSFESLRKAVNQVVEGGKGIHISLGRGTLLSQQFGGSLMALNLLKSLAKLSLNGDIPPIATSGDGLINILSQETLQSAYDAGHLPEGYGLSGSQVTGVTPYSYVAGAMMAQREDDQAVLVIAGHYGAEAGLLADMAERSRAHTISGTDDLSAQSVLFVTSRAPLIGEEFFAAGAYIRQTLLQTASVKAQDLLRLILAAAIILGVILKLVGVL